eukprot:TRINITY_DN6965_c0_g1_i2.p1 TRINITY_DN6965_c0_g1~~TRINITY_DN6965_c0_g1_i2.p1  ORF type:complete len:262 (-),score=55.75 TRINITY_DN6965_c0_g1_i2:84-758(-)
MSEIWERSIVELPANTDIPRLCKKIVIHHEEKTVFDGSEEAQKEKSNAEVTKEFFQTTSELLKDEQTQESLKNYEDFVKETGDTGEQINAFFAEILKKHGETTSLLIFKGIHQKLIFPAFYCMKDILQPNIGKFKDLRGSWSVIVEIDNDTAVIKHKKRQQALNTTQELPDYEFSWQLSFTIDLKEKKMQKSQTHIAIMEVNVNPQYDKKQQMDAFFEKNTTIQ